MKHNRLYKMKCPYCPKKFTDRNERSHHVAVHVTDTIRKGHPGLLEMILPLGLATWDTTGEVRNIRLRKLEEPSGEKAEPK